MHHANGLMGGRIRKGQRPDVDYKFYCVSTGLGKCLFKLAEKKRKEKSRQVIAKNKRLSTSPEKEAMAVLIKLGKKHCYPVDPGESLKLIKIS